ncbi:MAG: response regulator [Chloroflexi bacterium]|nr:response regulator [Chloroflexota bacterium]
MSSTNIVLIDDEQSLRDVIEEGLVELFGCTVRAVSDGESGLACLRESPSDVLLVDLLMPGINGFEVLERLNSGVEKGCRPKRVIAMSALTDLDTVQALRDLGVDAVLPKPFSLQELRLALNLGEPGTFEAPVHGSALAHTA